LFLSYDGMTDPLGQSQVIPYLAGLTKKGYDVSLISFEKKDKFQKLGQFIQSKLDAAGIYWQPLSFHSKPPVIAKWWDVQLMKTTAGRLHKAKKFDLIHCRSYIAADIGLDLKRKTGVKMLFDMRGFWADEKADGGHWNTKRFFWKQVYQYYKKKEKEFIRETDHIITLTQAGKNEIQSWDYYDREVSITVVPCCADADLFSLTDEKQKQMARQQLGLSADTLVLGYLGSVGMWYMLNEMLEFFKQLLVKYPDAVFLFITNSDKQIILDKFSEYQLSEKNVMLINVNYSEVPFFMKASDLSISFIKPVFSKKGSSPVKVGETLCMGIPLITNDIGDCGTIIRECNAGLVIDEFSPAVYDTVISQIKTLQSSDKATIRENSLHYYGLKEGVEKYAAVYQSILSELQPATNKERELENIN
jgi:glycosyltransferase involved in cell wall biosynthesis